MPCLKLTASAKFCEEYKLISSICEENLGLEMVRILILMFSLANNYGWTNKNKSVFFFLFVLIYIPGSKTAIQSPYSYVTVCQWSPFIKNQISARLCCLPLIWCMFLPDCGPRICFYHCYFSIRCLTGEITPAWCGRILLSSCRGVSSQ